MNKFMKYVVIPTAIGVIAGTNIHNYRGAKTWLDVSGVPAEYRDTARLYAGDKVRKRMERTNPLFRPGIAVALACDGQYFPVEPWDW